MNYGRVSSIGYNAFQRLAPVSNAVFSVAYLDTSDGHDAGYALTLTNGVVLNRAVVRDAYRRQLVSLVSNEVDSAVVSSYQYGYDTLARVTSRNADTFGYNARSEVTAASVRSNAYTYAYDSIGNHTTASVNSDTTTYTANALNQYSQISVSSVPSVDNPTYDLDGNLLTNGVWSYAYDAENRLTAAYSNNVCVVSNAYDHMSRRVLKWTPCHTTTFVYDGWNLLQETISTASGTTTNHYIWGRDLSGTMQGAGGVGGLLAVLIDETWYFPLYDNNGNVMAYVDESGVVVAEYVYDAFGETIAKSGSMADVFAHRFRGF
jgi:YD repeat-containing protein